MGEKVSYGTPPIMEDECPWKNTNLNYDVENDERYRDTIDGRDESSGAGEEPDPTV